MEEVLEQTYFGNSPGDWLRAAIVAAVTYAALWAIEWVVTRRFAKFAERSRFTFDDVAVAVLRATRFWFTLLVAVWAGSLTLRIDEGWFDHFQTALELGLILQILLWGNAGIRAAVRGYTARRAESDPSAITTMRAVGMIARLALGALLALSALAVLGFDVTALLAGLGIGGIAVAFALQGVLGDLFASLSIVLDKPFVIGDTIVVGQDAGTVEQIGLKTTRVRALSGEQLIFSNSDLLASRVRNMKRMAERRVVFRFGVTYETPRAKLVDIPQRIQAIVEAQPDTRFDRAHLAAFGPSSLDYEVVYYTKDPDYRLYADEHEQIMLAIIEYFERDGIEFAYPTQVVHLAPSAARSDERP